MIRDVHLAADKLSRCNADAGNTYILKYERDDVITSNSIIFPIRVWIMVFVYWLASFFIMLSIVFWNKMTIYIFFIYLCSPTSGPRPAAHLYSLAFYKCSRTRQIMTRKHEFVAFNQLNHIISGRDVIMKNLPRTVILMAVIDSFDIDISIHILKYRYIGVKQI